MNDVKHVIVQIARNKRASFDFELSDSFEAGLVLLGSEVKMIRTGKVDLVDAWCSIERGEAFIQGMKIEELSHAAFGHEPKRKRKLLLHEKEIETINRKMQRDGMTIVATKLYMKDGRAKIEICLARGKKKADKRETLKAKDAERETRTALMNSRKGRG